MSQMIFMKRLKGCSGINIMMSIFLLALWSLIVIVLCLAIRWFIILKTVSPKPAFRDYIRSPFTKRLIAIVMVLDIVYLIYRYIRLM